MLSQKEKGVYMNKTVAVIIPCYKAHDTIIRAISSIACQTMINKIKTYVVVDADKENYDYLSEMYSNFMDIEIIYKEINQGPGLARQTGIDSSNEPFLIFLDADDTFSGAFAIEKIYQRISTEQARDVIMVIGTFLEETKNGTYIKHENDMIWMHGKIYRRSFLDKYNIRFNETRANEDVGFNKVIQFIENPQERIGIAQDLVYYWHWRDDSIVRINNMAYNYNESIEGQAINLVYAVERTIKLGIFNDRVRKFIMESMAQYYLLYNRVLYRAKEQKKHAMKWISYFYKRCYKLLDEQYIKDNELNIVSYILVTNSKELVHVIPKLTYDVFMEKVKQNTKK
jgi:glycosyltransferase involved in cell wall biosynthesis